LIFHLNSFISSLGVFHSKEICFLKSFLGIETLEEALYFFPKNYEERLFVKEIEEIKEGKNISFVAKIISIEEKETSKKRLIAKVYDGKNSAFLVWFNKQKQIKNFLSIGQEYVISGKSIVFNGNKTIIHPEVKLKKEDFKPFSFLISPKYTSPEKKEANKSIQKIYLKILKCYDKLYIQENLPKEILLENKLISRREALLKIHFPESIDSLNKSIQRLKFEELFYMQIRFFQKKYFKKEEENKIILNRTFLFRQFLKESFSFQLTSAQEKVIKEIYSDISSGKRMNRLLQGDVGSGKTVVSFLTLLIAIDSGYQVAIIAPTEILVEQHYLEIKNFALKNNIKTAILTSSTNKVQRKQIIIGLEEGEIKVIFGTHSLLNSEVEFKKIGLVIIDEQQKFGVEQRARMYLKSSGVLPHVLSMTATPIPRTLLMTIYGDMDISIIDKSPPGRKVIKTVHQYTNQIKNVFNFIRQQISNGNQVYIVYPIIDELEKSNYENLTQGYEKISKEFFGISVGVIHGRMKSVEKEEAMKKFVEGITKILVCTSVIEVGVNVQNATLIVIMNSERFGLSQLHQLRGRVGRGVKQSFCILVTDHNLSNQSKQRVRAMLKTNDGFLLADYDLQLRGPGDVFGSKQSGAIDLKIADLSKDFDLLNKSKEAVNKVLKEDPKLEMKQYQMVKVHIEEKRKGKLESI